MKINFIVFLFLVKITYATEFMMACTDDQVCISNYNSSYACQENVCKHTSLFPLDSSKIISLFLILFLSIFTNASGLGGGALFVPLYMTMLNFTIGDAIPLSNVTVLAGGLTSVFLIYKEKDPLDKNILLIDYKLSSFIIPIISAGTMVGVIVVKILPPILLLTILIIYVIYASNNVIKKAIQQHKKEELLKAQKNDQIELLVQKNEKNQKLKQETIERSFSQLFEPYRNDMIFCIASYFIILFSALLRGGKATSSLIGIEPCSFISWLIFLITIIILYIGSIKIWVGQSRLEKLDIEYKIEEGKASSELFKKLFFTVFYSGILAGALGLGGGLVINPVLLQFGFRPEKASGVSILIVLFTSLTTTTQFLIAGAFNVSYAFYIMCISIIGSFIGNVYLKIIVKKYDKPSILIWILAILLLTSGVVLLLTGLGKIFTESNLFKFGYPC